MSDAAHLWVSDGREAGMEWDQVIELAIRGFEVAGVAALIIGSLYAGVRFGLATFSRRAPGRDGQQIYTSFRQSLGRTILLGLELLVIADIINSIAIEPSLQSIGALGLLVLIRTFLSWSLEVEIDGRWPWQRVRGQTDA